MKEQLLQSLLEGFWNMVLAMAIGSVVILAIVFIRRLNGWSDED